MLVFTCVNVIQQALFKIHSKGTVQKSVWKKYARSG